MLERPWMVVEKTKILVVDDEIHQLETVCRGLFLYDYDSVGVSSAAEALVALDGQGGESFDLMLTDLTMPGASGMDLIEKAKRLRPKLPIIVITGLAASREVEVVQNQGIPILAKPFEPDSLDRAIRSLLDEMK